MKSRFNGLNSLVLGAALAAIVAACNEQLDAGLACPALCPEPPRTVLDTTLFAVEFDTSVSGFPALGAEVQFFLASLGDTLETRVVLRYDSLPDLFRHLNSAEDSSIVFVDTGAVLKLRLAANDTLGGPVTIEAYEVDLDGPDNVDPLAADAAFTPDRLLGTRTFAAESLKDSIRVPIDEAVLLERIRTEPPGNRLRVGLRVTSDGAARVNLFSANAGGSALLEFRPSPDTTVPKLSLGVRSLFPAETFIADDLSDYMIISKAPPDTPADALRVGGLRGSRAYLRFNIPSRILDSSSVVRTTLFLTQRPISIVPEPGDTVSLQQFAVTASPTIKDLERALYFLNITRRDSTHLVPTDSGVRAFEMIELIRAWRTTSPDSTVRAMVLRAIGEGTSPGFVDFFSSSAPLSVRPRLRITYMPRQQPSLP